MAKLLFSYSFYNAKAQDYEVILTKLRQNFSAYRPDLFLNNPEYLIFILDKKDWQKEMVALIAKLKAFVNGEVESLRNSGKEVHVVYRFGILEMESTIFQFPPDLEDDDD